MNRRTFIGGASAAWASNLHGQAAARDAIHKHIDQNLERHIARIQTYIRQPSISAEKRGIAECAELTRKYLADAGCQETALVPTKGHPGVWGHLNSGAARTLVVYWMYDVQPVNASEWTTPPFEARIASDASFGPKGRILRGRGATNTKGPEVAFLNALESIRAAAGSLPVNLLFVCEGEEELGSPNLHEVVTRYRDPLAKADGVLYAANSMGRDGGVTVTLGNKGIVYMELEAVGGPHGGPKKFEVHSSQKAVIDSPVWRLIQALASMTDPSGNRILIEGVTAKVREPNARERDVFDTYVADFNDATVKRQLEVDRWIGGVEKREMLRKLWFDCSLNIDGIWAGYTGPGTKTILPHKANAKIDFRLVPDQQAADISPLVRKHLDKHGFTDVKINWWNGYDWSQTEPGSDLEKTAIAVYRDYGARPKVALRLAGSAPFYLFTRELRLPLVAFGLGHGGGAHSVDEYMVIEAAPPVRGLADMEKAFADFLLRFAAG